MSRRDERIHVGDATTPEELLANAQPMSAPELKPRDAFKAGFLVYGPDDEAEIEREWREFADTRGAAGSTEGYREEGAGEQASRLHALAHCLRTQDNRITADPIFAVQQKVREYGNDFEDGADGHEWYHAADWEKASPAKTAKLEAEADLAIEEDREPNYGPYVRMGYRDRWEFVTACFTEAGCQAYIDVNGHNLKEPRIYTYSAHRNKEWKFLRGYLLALAAPTPSTSPAEPGDDR